MADRYVATETEAKTAREMLAAYAIKIAAGDMTVADWYGKAGQELFVLRQDEDALASIQRALELDSGSAECWSLCGTILGTLGRDRDALTAFDTSLQIDPSNAYVMRQRDKALSNLDAS